MPLSRWMSLIAVLVGIGCLEVAQRNAIVLSGYAVGSQAERLHAQQTEVAWLSSKVTGLSSPSHLAQVARERQLKLVAWSTLSTPPPLATLGMPSRGSGPHEAPLAHLAAVDPTQPMTNDSRD